MLQQGIKALKSLVIGFIFSFECLREDPGCDFKKGEKKGMDHATENRNLILWFCLGTSIMVLPTHLVPSAMAILIIAMFLHHL
jgi:hypothetical protein